MTYLELVNFAMQRAGVREEDATTLVGATGLVRDFAAWVDDAWWELQQERENPPWWFMMNLDQTLSLTQGTDTYAMPAGLTTLDWRTCTVYTTAKQDEVPIRYIPYDRWRLEYDTRTYGEQRPQYITLGPDQQLRVFPFPDQTYTLRFDGVIEPAALSLDADTPATLPAPYHRVIAFKAIMSYALQHEDGAALERGNHGFRPIHDRMVNRQVEQVTIEKGRIYAYTPVEEY